MDEHEQELNSELLALSWLLANPSYLDRWPMLNEQTFSYPAAQLIFSIFKKSWGWHQELPNKDECVALLQRRAFQKGYAPPVVARALEDVKLVYGGKHTSASGELIREVLVSSLVREISTSYSEMAPSTLVEKVPELTRKLEVLDRRRDSKYVTRVNPLSPSVLADPVGFLDQITGGGVRIPTGLPRVDLMLGGGLIYGETAVLSAPFGVGKTLLLESFALAALCAGFRVAYFGLDNLMYDLIKRLYAAVLKEHIDTEHENSSWSKALLKATDGGDDRLSFFTLESGRYTVKDLEHQLDEIERDYRGYDLDHGVSPARAGKVDVVFSDFTDKLVTHRKAEALRLEIWDVYQAATAAAVSRNLVWWHASQTNQEGYEKAIQRARFIAESKAKNWEVAHSFALGRGTADIKAGTGWLTCHKSRRTELLFRVFPLLIDTPTMTVQENLEADVGWLEEEAAKQYKNGKSGKSKDGSDFRRSLPPPDEGRKLIREKLQRRREEFYG